MDDNVSIGTVKRDISELVNRVAYGGERIVLTSRGKPKAALVSMEDYQTLTNISGGWSENHMHAWLALSKELSDRILADRKGVLIDTAAILEQDRADLEARDDRLARSD